MVDVLSFYKADNFCPFPVWLSVNLNLHQTLDFLNVHVTILQKLTHHKEKAEKHFELYAEYNKKYIDSKSKSDGNGDIRKLEKRMNKEGKRFTHHDIIVQDLSEEYENLQQQYIATMMQLAQVYIPSLYT